jgi:hypothetical protein
MDSERSTGSNWIISSRTANSRSHSFFTRANTPGSLVGFDGGSITSGGVVNFVTFQFIYGFSSGSITPVPEPASLTLLCSARIWRYPPPSQARDGSV